MTKKCLLMIVIALAAGTGWKCTDGSTNVDVEMRELNESEKKLVEADNLFSFSLFKRIAESESDKNIFISPLSVSMALGMTLNGARGTTGSEITSALGFAGLTQEEINQSYHSLIGLLTNLDPKVKFNIANSIWTREGFEVKEEFYEVNRDFFDAVVSQLDFNDPNSAGVINSWVNDKTSGKIKNIVSPPIDPLTVMFLINAIYFKGDWTLQFDKGATTTQPFYVTGGNTISCDLMHLKEDFRYLGNDRFQAVMLPYGDGDFSMTVFLPRLNDNAVDIGNFIAGMNREDWVARQESFDSLEVDLYLPRFELEYEITLNNILQTLGINAAFDPAISDFTGIADRDDLHISNVLHKTYVKVDEKGTEAAAVTSVTVGVTSIPEEPVTMRVDRPFVIIIQENSSGTILFMGKINDPS